MPLRNMLDRKLETMTDDDFEAFCKSVIRGICKGAALYFGGMIALDLLLKWWGMI